MSAAKVVVPTFGLGYLGYNFLSDEGARRSFYFWRNAFPIYLRYRYVMAMTRNMPCAEKDAAFEKLHEKYADDIFDIVKTLKGFYVKIAQIGSTRADFMPQQFLDRATALQDQAPRMSFDRIEEIMQSSMDGKLYDIFETIDKEPLGVASIGQVHRAVLKHNKAEVVVKVQFPEAETRFRADIKTIKQFCKLAQPDHVPYLSEVEKQFMNEFDYRKEAENLELIANNLNKNDYWKKQVVVPTPYKEYCTHDMLVMSYLKGPKLVDGIHEHFKTIAKYKNTTVEELKRKIALQEKMGLKREEGLSSMKTKLLDFWITGNRKVSNATIGAYNYSFGLILGKPIEYYPSMQLLDLPKILKKVVQVHGYELLVDGAFNGDPHPGNILLLNDGRLGLIDYGQVKTISNAQRKNIAKLIVALVEKDADRILDVMTNDIGIKTKHMNSKVIEKLATVLIDRDDSSVTDGMNPQVFMESLNKLDPIVCMPDDYVMAFRMSLLLRGLSYALHYENMSHAKEWETLARKAIQE